MLDTPTKRRIDTARDILVGKVPDPKSQVEQITIALIYKFMDDMDAEAEELGGKRKFFSGKFSRYGWAKLMNPAIGGHELIGLYGEGIATMPQNPGIPPLFRDIFKNAYLPYRDPETLKSFLKVIDEFTYDHSERLGDAFEYLLSVLGSQGDAGQFRTPRHIIDFIVTILDPKKNETVLDPACGTAGFLISAWKHILKANTDPKGNITLTPDEKSKLSQNFKGYDISPDMVRLSLVNLYLHGFTDPHIYEYDTLTSEERWNEFADVILANPPFMSPKGGIRPHTRFSISAKRSEVLFVDYIAEHLTPKGRAGIIVPEGIIFQNQTAYKDLRKVLVENSLVAVISLPAGVFQPYSGVKTSILILDSLLAKRSDTVAFFKIENDGFSLGAQRRPIDGEELTQVSIEVDQYFQMLHAQSPPENMHLSLGHIVEKEKLSRNGDYNLIGERYRNTEARINVFPLVKINEVCTLNPRKTHLAHLEPNSSVSFVPMASLNEFNIEFQPNEEKRLSEVSGSYTYFEDNDVLLAKVTPCFENGKAGIARGLTNKIGFGSSEFYVLRSKGKVLPEWIYFCIMHPYFRGSAINHMTGTGGLQRVPRDFVEKFQIPLPSLEAQGKIAAEINSYQKLINGAKTVLHNYRPSIPIDPDWPIVELGDVLTLQRGYDLPKQEWRTGSVPIVGSNGVIGFHAEHKEVSPGVVTGRSGTIGKVHYIEENYWPHNTSLFVKDFKGNNPRFVKFLLESIDLKSLGERTAAVPSLDRKNAHQLKVSLPPIEVQHIIVAEIEAEQALIKANHELISRFEKKIQDTLSRVWDGKSVL